MLLAPTSWLNCMADFPCWDRFAVVAAKKFRVHCSCSCYELMKSMFQIPNQCWMLTLTSWPCSQLFEAREMSYRYWLCPIPIYSRKVCESQGERYYFNWDLYRFLSRFIRLLFNISMKIYQIGNKLFIISILFASVPIFNRMFEHFMKGQMMNANGYEQKQSHASSNANCECKNTD